MGVNEISPSEVDLKICKFMEDLYLPNALYVVGGA
jgi:hypothetical protein